MIVDVASDKLAICHWVVDGQRSEGVFRVRFLVWCKTGQQSVLWPETTSRCNRVVVARRVRVAARAHVDNAQPSGGVVFVQLELQLH